MPTLSANFIEAIAPHVQYHTEAHSHTQIDHFMIGGGGDGDTWGMYRQACRELSGRQALLVGLKHSIATLRLDLREQKLRLKPATSGGGEAEDIERERVLLEMGYIAVKIEADEQREARALFEGNRILDQAVKHMATLREVHGWADDYELTADDLHRLDEDYWIRSVRQQCAINHYLRKDPPVDVIQMLPRLPPRMARPIKDALMNPVGNYDEFGFFATTMELREVKRHASLHLGGIAR